MRQFHLDFENHAVTEFQEARAIVQSAFDSQDPVTVAGELEGVEVSFDLRVLKVTQHNLGIRKLLEFSGVTRPDNEPYSAKYRDRVPDTPVELRIYNKLED